ncbi:MAG: DUF4426 domain-containing protein [Pseudomonadales bacterium]|nr:DUF4426 domain-containing protein [Pseudomonadales bacterium]
MNYLYKLCFSALIIVFLPASMIAVAEQKIREVEGVLGEGETTFVKAPYEVHFSTFNTSFVSPEVAKAYNIVRSKSKGLVNISVLKTDETGKKVPVTAAVTGQSYDLILTKELDFFEVKEQNAIYYLAQFDIEHKIPFYFTINVKPDKNKAAMKVKFKKIMWVDGRD